MSWVWVAIAAHHPPVTYGKHGRPSFGNWVFGQGWPQFPAAWPEAMAAGGRLAAPIFTEFMQTALADQPAKEFQLPAGINLIAIDRRTGLRASVETSGPTIMEAFKPGTEPPSSYSVVGFQDHMGRRLTVSPDADRYVGSGGTGGL